MAFSVGCVRLELITCKFIFVQIHEGKDFLCPCVCHIAKIEFLLIFPILLAFETKGEFVGDNNPNIVSLQTLCLMDGRESNHITADVVSEKGVKPCDM